MKSWTKHSIAGVFSIGVAVVITAGYLAAWGATQAVSPHYPRWYTGMDEAGAAARAGRYEEALALAKELDAIPSKPPLIAEAAHAMIVQYAMKIKDYPTAARMTDQLLTANEGFREEIIKNCVLLAVLQNQIPKAQTCAQLYGAN